MFISFMSWNKNCNILNKKDEMQKLCHELLFFNTILIVTMVYYQPSQTTNFILNEKGF